MPVKSQKVDVTDPGKADFVSKVVKAANTVFGIFVVVIFDEAKAVVCQRSQ